MLIMITGVHIAKLFIKESHRIRICASVLGMVIVVILILDTADIETDASLF